MLDYTYADLSKMIDHSLLNPTLTVEQLESGIDLAIAYDVASICIMPYYHRRCVERLKGTSIAPSSTVGFPHGGHTTRTKLIEAEQLIEDGCMELDMVSNISAVLSSNWRLVREEIGAMTRLAHNANRKIKVIFENCYLSDAQKIELCQICCEHSADWVKTSTGYGTGGATLEDLRLMLDNVSGGVQVKAAGGVRDCDALLHVRSMGVTRVGASRTAEILGEARQRLGLPPITVASSPSANPGY
ncbi:Deoxyribose-phosphate aldolase 1 [Pirellula sp. SH-Sr6A]|uniref:deoxyribose-phosphate aldolase n=1 Tax=Pirellula sp. SH-Sr6A TaxID=1632865 RepID=UPI00078C7971|nr:deoxyribose-phosphate aldolase [Pirellula sp. SH-Sr6A]AMV32679.1 Deoxyribose-phosphate aldolase 1 [Pirellula sp. SH-Sr6A]